MTVIKKKYFLYLLFLILLNTTKLSFSMNYFLKYIYYKFAPRSLAMRELDKLDKPPRMQTLFQEKDDQEERDQEEGDFNANFHPYLVTFDSTGKYIIACSSNRLKSKIKIWDVKTGKCINKIILNDWVIRLLACPDKTILILYKIYYDKDMHDNLIHETIILQKSLFRNFHKTVNKIDDYNYVSEKIGYPQTYTRVGESKTSILHPGKSNWENYDIEKICIHSFDTSHYAPGYPKGYSLSKKYCITSHPQSSSKKCSSKSLLWEISNKEYRLKGEPEEHEYDCSYENVIFSPCENFLVFHRHDYYQQASPYSYENIHTGSIKLFNIKNNREIKAFEGDLFAFSKNIPFSKYFSFYSKYNGTITIWDIENHTFVRTVQIHKPILFFDLMSLFRDLPKNHVTSLLFHPNANYIIFSHENMIAIFDIQENKYITKFEAHDERIANLAINPDGTKVTSCSPREPLAQNKIKVWDITGLCDQAKYKQQEQIEQEDVQEKNKYLKDNFTGELEDLDVQYPIKLKDKVILSASKALLN